MLVLLSEQIKNPHSRFIKVPFSSVDGIIYEKARERKTLMEDDEELKVKQSKITKDEDSISYNEVDENERKFEKTRTQMNYVEMMKNF